MATHAGKFLEPMSLLLPALLFAGLTGMMAMQTGLPRPPVAAGAVAAPVTVTIAPRTFGYRPAGKFQQGTAVVDAPLTEITGERLEIMKFQVSVADYARCVADGACEAPDRRSRAESEMPVTGVSFIDAEAYARWLSDATGQLWRLPTDAEWAFAAGSRFADDALGVDGTLDNPADRWLAQYEKEAALGAGASAMPEVLGFFGENEFGVADLASSVWEWTASCDSRTRIDGNGAVINSLESCGVRIVEGRHRTGMSSFVRDARTGGCTVGAPPDNLGFRLVRDTGWQAWINQWWKSLAD
ncbi:MAG: SUMF1/EgtB/PvdO family nonheme iron enzyme [Devosia sp.]